MCNQCGSHSAATGVTSCKKSTFTPWLSQSQRIHNSPQAADSTGQTHPYPNTLEIHNNSLLMLIFLLSTPITNTSHRSTLRQTFCSQNNFTAGQGSMNLWRQGMQIVQLHAQSLSAPWSCRSWCHFCWQALAPSLLGCCLRWFK